MVWRCQRRNGLAVHPPKLSGLLAPGPQPPTTPRNVAGPQAARPSVAGPGHVRIRVKAAGVNFADIMARLGVYPDAPPLPAVVGYEVAGTALTEGDLLVVATPVATQATFHVLSRERARAGADPGVSSPETVVLAGGIEIRYRGAPRRQSWRIRCALRVDSAWMVSAGLTPSGVGNRLASDT